MSALFWARYIVRSLRRGGRRVLFALACIAVGVAGVVALELATLTVQNALTSNVRAANGGDVSIASESAPLSRADLGVFRQLQREGRISQWLPVSTLHATTVLPGLRLIPFSVDVVPVPPYPLGGEPTFVSPANGNAESILRRPATVLVTSVLADELGAHIGSHVTVRSIGGAALHVTVGGILAETSLEHAAAMTVSARNAAPINGGYPHYTAVYANVPGGSSAQVGALLRTRFPLAQVQTVSESLQSTETEVHDFRQFLLLVGLLALLVAGIGILNAMQSLLTWRRLEIAMLKALGFGQGTLYALFGGEAVVLGLVGGVVGVVVGALAGSFITGALARALALQVTFVVDGLTLLAGVLLGVGATAIFAVFPVVRAAEVRPLEIMREGAPAPGAVRTVVLLAVVLGLFTALAAVVVGDLETAIKMVVGAAVVCGVLAGIFALVTGWLGRLGPPAGRQMAVGVLVASLAAILYTLARLPALAPLAVLWALLWLVTIAVPRSSLLPLLVAVRSLARRRSRTAVTLVAFLSGVLAMSLTLTVALGLQGQITSALASASAVNLIAVDTSASEGSVVRAASHLPGVKSLNAVLTVNVNPVSLNGRPVSRVVPPRPATGDREDSDFGARLLGSITGFDMKHGARPDSIIPMTIVTGRQLGQVDAGTNHIVVRRELQHRPFFLSLGDTVTFRESGTSITRAGRIVGFYTRPRRRGFAAFFSGSIIADRSFVRAIGAGDEQSTVAMRIDPASLSADATHLQNAVPGALVVDVADLTAVIETILNDLLNLLAVITALALGAGLTVVANGVTLAMLERRREIALYKAIGFGPGDVLRFVLVENALAGLLAGAVSVLAVAAALGFISRVALQQSIGFDPVVATLVLLVAAALAIVAAYLAARSPLRVRPIEALRND